MEVKKSHKADLEHLRPWMFLAGLVATVVGFFLILEVGVFVSSEDSWDEDIVMDLDMELNDQRDMIAAAQKELPKEEKEESDDLNKVDETAELAPEILEPQAPEEEAEEEVEEEEPPINLNEENEEVLRIVEELPQYPGGMVEFMKWLTATLKYPPAALRQKIQGKVMVAFIVNIDGSITNLELTQRVNTLLDNEALRVMRLMPKWTPGKDHGVVCRTKVAIPIVFEI